MPIPEHYLEKIYAGLLGKCIGIRVGAPVEPTVWTYARIRAAYGDISGYVKDYRNFAADDDFNGPAFFIRALVDYGRNREITARDVGRTWLEYTREEKGFYWWGGVGRSTEHTAYVNLKSGIEAPASGSIAVNGKAIAEQIGGQIFVDTWGLVYPDDPERAARAARMAASVSHDGEGLNGAAFIAGAISAAFSEPDPAKLVDRALALIPADSEYARVVRAVRDFHAGAGGGARGEVKDAVAGTAPDAAKGGFRACMDMLTAEFGYDRYPGVCHIIPNAGVCALALLYSADAPVGGQAGDRNGSGTAHPGASQGSPAACGTPRPASVLSRGVEIATMCGWDTDCNAGNVGTILGVAGGLAGVEDKYRAPMNDVFVCSSASGSLNIVDLPGFAAFLAALGRREEGIASTSDLARIEGSTDIGFDFDLPGSTHGFRAVSNSLRLRNRRLGHGRGCLEALVDRPQAGVTPRLFWKPFYRREDFDDERYSPAFSPIALSGQVLRCRMAVERWEGPESLRVKPYVRLTHDRSIIEGAPFLLTGAPTQPVAASGDKPGPDAVSSPPPEPGLALAPKMTPGSAPVPSTGHAWKDVEYILPDSGGSAIDEVGFVIDASDGLRWFGYLLLDDFSITGPGRLDVDFGKQAQEFATVTPGAFNHGSWTLEGGSLAASSGGTAEFFVGRFHARDQRAAVTVVPQEGSGHCLMFRARGTITGYAAGFTAPGKVGILKNDMGWSVLAETAFAWEYGKEYRLEVEVEGDGAVLSVDGRPLVRARGITLQSGMTGLARTAPGRCLFSSFSTVER